MRAPYVHKPQRRREYRPRIAYLLPLASIEAFPVRFDMKALQVLKQHSGCTGATGTCRIKIEGLKVSRSSRTLLGDRPTEKHSLKSRPRMRPVV